MKKKYVVIVAGGKGTRINSIVPKQFLLLKGKPLLMHTIEAFYRYDPKINIILVLPREKKQYWSSLCQKYRFEIIHQVVDGGTSRFYSVKNGILLVKKKSLVAIHDGVRPLVNQRLIVNAFEKAAQFGAVYPAILVTDTLRQVVEKEVNRIADRSVFYLVQTPQVFFSDFLAKAYQETLYDNYTDDSSVVESTKNCTPVMIEGSRLNIKITTPMDLFLARKILECKQR